MSPPLVEAFSTWVIWIQLDTDAALPAPPPAGNRLVSVVSMPSTNVFDRQDAAYRDANLLSVFIEPTEDLAAPVAVETRLCL